MSNAPFLEPPEPDEANAGRPWYVRHRVMIGALAAFVVAFWVLVGLRLLGWL